MKLDIIMAGVGGQGILSIATILGEAATRKGLYLKQSEVHGMSQRGGAVESNFRLSTEPICSDLIGTGKADMIIAMEPMEALRYVQYLSKDGIIFTSSVPFNNIVNYPDYDIVKKELESFPHVASLDIEAAASKIGNPKGSNMVLLGMAASYIKILDPSQIRDAISVIFASKGANVIEANLKAFDEGLKSIGR